MTVHRGEYFAQNDVWIYDLARSTARRLTYGGAPSFLVWSPDSRELVYNKVFAEQVMRVRADGTGGAGTRVSTTERDGAPAAWSRADNVLLLRDRLAAPGSRVLSLQMDAPGAPALFKETSFDVSFLELSPDGRWLAYVSNATGTPEVYVEPYPGPGAAERVSTDGGQAPSWAGNELFYLRVSPNGRVEMMVVDVETTNGFRAGSPRVLFELSGAVAQGSLGGPQRVYDVAADGRRFVASKLTTSLPDPTTRMHVVLNWDAELRRRVPVNGPSVP